MSLSLKAQDLFLNPISIEAITRAILLPNTRAARVEMKSDINPDRKIVKRKNNKKIVKSVLEVLPE